MNVSPTLEMTKGLVIPSVVEGSHRFDNIPHPFNIAK